VQGGYAYVGVDREFVVLDVSNPANPTRVGAWALPGVVTDACVVGSYAYVSHASNYAPDGTLLHGGMRIIDISNPASPIEVSYYLYEESFPTSVAASGDYAYLTDWTDLQVVDVSRPARPRRAALFPGLGYRVVVAGDYAYITWEGCSMRSPCNGQFRIVDISDPRAPADAAVMAYPQRAVGALAVSGHYAYVGVEGLRIFDVASPASPVEVGFLPASGFSRPLGLAIDGARAYYVDFSQALNAQALYIVDVTDPAAPVTVNAWALPSSSLTPQNMAVVGRFVYLTVGGCFAPDNADCGNGLMVIDVADPGAPVEVGRYVAPYPIPPPIPSPAP
jgi:hypothetical protein